MQIGKAIGGLRALKKSVLADGKVDWDETERLLAYVKPLAKRRGFLFEDYVRLLEKCREDGKITPEESDRLAVQLDYLCSFLTNLRLKFWLVVAVALLLVVGSAAVAQRLCETVARVDSSEVLEK